jgi:hypothetical protein
MSSHARRTDYNMCSLLCVLVAGAVSCSSLAHAPAPHRMARVAGYAALTDASAGSSSCTCYPPQICGFNGTCFNRSCGLYLSQTMCDCITCLSLGGYCGSPQALNSSLCYNSMYPQCVIDSVSLAGGSVGPVVLQNASTCSGVLTGDVSVVMFDYGGSVLGAELVTFIEDLGLSAWWQNAASFSLPPE